MANGVFELSSLLTSTAFGVAINGINVNNGAGHSVSAAGGVER
ncbi:MAG: hypothetical protein IRD7MM_00765 [Candidatus Midichloria mitochondrii]|nr:hypothetical protein [Candidatus Midichloria mitochondrii]